MEMPDLTHSWSALAALGVFFVEHGGPRLSCGPLARS